MTLAYLNENDKAYGLAGMVVSLAALDAMDRVAYVELDSDGPMVTFSQEFYNPGIGAISIKESWNHLCNNYYITAGMVLGNLMARSNVRWQKGVPDDVTALVREEILKEGRETCSLEDDEVAAIYRRVNSIMRQIFHNPQVAPAVADIATEISRRRHVSGRELSEIVRQLL